ncbi:hypothetical protein M0802_000575 [Mischocyttarus mexicanus]|nr:hypothetical protein M0802_000575 [Mischocyttarus mexicanus]
MLKSSKENTTTLRELKVQLFRSKDKGCCVRDLEIDRIFAVSLDSREIGGQNFDCALSRSLVPPVVKYTNHYLRAHA